MVRSRWIGFTFGALVAGLMILQVSAEDGAGGAPPGGGGRGRMGPGGGFFGGPGAQKASLLRAEQVHKELGVTDEQKTKVTEALNAYTQKERELPRLGRGSELSKEEREKRVAESTEARKKLLADLDKQLAGILKAEQCTRLDQIVFQQRGVEALKDADVVKKLGLKEDQIKKIDEAQTWGREEQRKLSQEMRGQGGQEGFRQMQEKMAKIRKDVEAKAMEALTKEQKDMVEKMKGKAFELDRAAMMRGRQGSGFGGGEGRRQGRRGGEPKGGGEPKQD